MTGPDPAATNTAGGRAGTGRCAPCGDELPAGARFCEACGAPTGDGTPNGAAAGAEATCPQCGGEVGPDGYCTDCGLRRPEPVVVVRHEPAACATPPGRRRARNEDAVALATTAEGWPVLVVADGVSASPNPHRAAASAVAAAAGRLAGHPFTGSTDLAAAVEDAQLAAAAVPVGDDPGWTDDGSYPATTIVVAVAGAGTVHTANVGDARAYVLEPAGQGWSATLLTTDDSVGHAVTAWLGADAPALAAHLATCEAPPAGLVVACSDGLWNYAASAGDFGDLAGIAVPGADPGAVPGPEALATACERFVSWALDQGGHDNVSVAAAPAGPPGDAAPAGGRHVTTTGPEERR